MKDKLILALLLEARLHWRETPSHYIGKSRGGIQVHYHLKREWVHIVGPSTDGVQVLQNVDTKALCRVVQQSLRDQEQAHRDYLSEQAGRCTSGGFGGCHGCDDCG